MKARLLSVQRTLFTLVVTSLVLSVLAFPHGHNRDYMAALDELNAFRSAFKEKELERSLLDYAQSQGVIAVADVAAAAKGPGVPKLRAAANAPKLLPRAEVKLDTLGAVAARTAGPTTLPIGVTSAADIGSAIAWRLTRSGNTADGELRSVALVPGAVSDAEVTRERDVAKARLAMLASDTALEHATKKLQSEEDRYTLLRKWKSSWKVLIKSDQARKDAKVALDAAQVDRDHKHADYERLAKAAESFHAQGVGDAAHAVAEVTVAQGKQETKLQIPVALETRQASLPQLQGIGLSATRAAGLWDEVQDKDAAQAIDAVRSHFTWHYRYVELGGIKVGGMTLLQLLPALLPLVLMLMLVRIRRVSVTYNPFGTMESTVLPRVGFGPRVLDGLALAILPFVAAILTTISLMAVGQLPVLPLLAAFASLGLGAYVFIELGSLQSLIDAVSRSHSTPPPKST
ncbi:MAG TPA: hypothetical protein VHM19_10010 [Polyangiales bacterium]|jgi:hypothetical protein|nr:hypothetical protein [Polyangiales bacterium]